VDGVDLLVIRPEMRACTGRRLWATGRGCPTGTSNPGIAYSGPDFFFLFANSFFK
tara:strand:- start:1096 stop:1260 length:165 start_codon:yes stop_codon:yes gene_type:complete